MANLPRALRPLCTFFLLCLPAARLSAEPARFDLAGPKVEIRVTRGGKMLPIASVPNLQPGDKLWLHPDLPSTQSVHYLLVAAFLRGTTNPPPDSWFTRIPTWDKHVRAEGVTVTVPEEAQQAILFLAPETGGDISTLRSAVRGRPGIFVRAAQDLAEAGFEQARIEKYLASMRMVPPSDPKALLDHSNLLARTLNLRPNVDCFKRPMDQQYACLTQTGTQTLLEDGHGQTVVSQLTSGPSSDFINAASATSLAGGGVYSAYVGAIVDLVRIMGGLHTAQYQYIPAIAFPQQESLELRLNTPPSFHNPKSVIVIGLPAVQKATPPPLRPADTRSVTCLLDPEFTLPVEGAPLVFSTAFAHDLVLHVEGAPDTPLVPDAFRGGLVVSRAHKRSPLEDRDAPPTATAEPKPAAPGKSAAAAEAHAAGPQTTGVIKGYWGFDEFTGPTLPLQTLPGSGWKLASADQQIIAGQENKILLTSSGTACVQFITLADPADAHRKLEWKQGGEPNVLEVNLPLHSSRAGDIGMSVSQFGKPEADAITTRTFATPAHIEAMEFHADDGTVRLTGTSLAEVKQVEIGGAGFSRTAPVTSGPADRDGKAPEQRVLSLPPGAEPPRLKAGDHFTGKVGLEDGRTVEFVATVQPPRPSVTILSRRFEPTTPSPIQLASADDLPLESRLILSLKSPSAFPRDGKVEIASPDNSLHTELSIAAGSLVLQDLRTVVAQVDLRKTFGDSAFGPLRLRLVSRDGTASDWIPLATLVRLPALKSLQCAAGAPDKDCTLTGSNLYLVNSVGSDASFSHTVDVPEGFVGDSLQVPHPAADLLYLHLRDDPGPANSASVPPAAAN